MLSVVRTSNGRKKECICDFKMGRLGRRTGTGTALPGCAILGPEHLVQGRAL